MGNYYELHLADSNTTRAIALSVDAFMLPALLQVSGSSLSKGATMCQIHRDRSGLDLRRNRERVAIHPK